MNSKDNADIDQLPIFRVYASENEGPTTFFFKLLKTLNIVCTRSV